MKSSRFNLLAIIAAVGMSLVKAIIQVHRGQIDVASSPDQGARFTISLPL